MSSKNENMSKGSPLRMPSCIYDSNRWNDPEQRNYIIHHCSNPKNTGGKRSDFHFHDDHENHHDERTYSCWYENEGMSYRCWSNPKKIAKCPFALSEIKQK